MERTARNRVYILFERVTQRILAHFSNATFQRISFCRRSPTQFRYSSEGSRKEYRLSNLEHDETVDMLHIRSARDREYPVSANRGFSRRTWQVQSWFRF